ncbi:MAG: glycosyltransferase family 4 protein [Nitrospirae bacterium]|nr:glycosyltransferase family 4 protein [Nitrospirota bacterium]
MKIALLNDSFLLDETIEINGTQVQLYNLARAFLDRHIEVAYILPSKVDRPIEEIIEGIRIFRVPCSNDGFSWIAELGRFNAALCSINPDIVYQRGRSYLTYIAANWAKKNNKAFIWASNGDDSCGFWKELSGIKKKSFPLWLRFILYPLKGYKDILIHKGIRMANRVINQTEHQKDQLTRNYGKEGIVFPSYYNISGASAMPKKEKICLWTANLIPRKQPQIFLRLAEYCKTLKDWQFVIVGGARNKQYQEQIMKEASHIPNVTVMGRVTFKQTESFFAKASLFVNTSFLEGVPNAMIQAWLNNTPVLSLSVDPNNWINRFNLGFFADGNLETFLSHGLKMLKDHTALLEQGVDCRNFAVKTFASDKIIDGYIEQFNKLTGHI